jgi:hypothetical protein
VEPAELYKNTSTPWRCRCLTCGREVTPRLGNVRVGHAACGYCAGLMVHPEEAALAMRAAGLEPLGPYPGAARPWPCRCERCGRESMPRYASVSNGSGCRHCGSERIGQALRMDGDQAAAAMLEAGVEPLDPYPGAGSPWRCKCGTCGREVRPRFADVRSGHAGCKWRAWQASAAGQRLEHEAATALMIEHDLEPLGPYPGAGRQWRCRCLRCGTEVTPRYGNIRQGWGGCPACRRAASSARQRGPEADAIEVLRAAGLEPLEPYQGVMTPWRSQCRTCGNQVAPLLNNIKKGQRGCKWCAGQVIDPAEASAVMRAAGLEPLTTYVGDHVIPQF